MLNRKRGRETQQRDRTGKIEKTLGFVPMPDHELQLSPKIQKRILGFFHRKHRRKLSERSPLQRLLKRIDREQTDGGSLTRKRQYAWIRNMLAPYLLTILGDRVELGHSLEGRTPFLDHHLFEAARHVPDRFKIHDGIEKYVLREAFRATINVNARDCIPEALGKD
jgi:asparagine synthase (glutamine-hydrolysing)